MTIENVACIDLGSNSCRLTIADKNGQILLKEAEATALAEGLAKSGILSDEAMKRGLNTLDRFSVLMKEHHVTSYRAVATAACRAADNSDEFIQKVKEKTGISLEVISPYEEAVLNLKGSLLNAPKNFEYAVVYDLGGASTEITLAENKINPKILHTVSIPLGARNSSEIYALNDYDQFQAQCLEDDVLPYVSDFILKSGLENLRDRTCLIATSSTPLRLNAMARGSGSYDRFENDGALLQTRDADRVIEKIKTMSFAERSASPYIAERADVFVPACVIFKTIYDTLKFENMIVSLKSAQDAMIKELCHGKNDQVSQNYTWPKKFDRTC